MANKEEFKFEFNFAKDLKNYNPDEYQKFSDYLTSKNIDITKVDPLDASIETNHQEFWAKNNSDKPYVDLLDRINKDYSHPNEKKAEANKQEPIKVQPIMEPSVKLNPHFYGDLYLSNHGEFLAFNEYLNKNKVIRNASFYPEIEYEKYVKQKPVPEQTEKIEPVVGNTDSKERQQSTSQSSDKKMSADVFKDITSNSFNFGDIIGSSFQKAKSDVLKNITSVRDSSINKPKDDSVKPN